MTVSTGADNAMITLDALDTIRHKLGGCIRCSASPIFRSVCRAASW